MEQENISGDKEKETFILSSNIHAEEGIPVSDEGEEEAMEFDQLEHNNLASAEAPHVPSTTVHASQIKCRRRLPLELQCDLVSTLPFHHGRRMLLLCHPIAKNCVALVRKQKQKFENRWDSTACHELLTLSEPDRLIVSGLCSAFAIRPIPKGNSGIFYYEVTCLGKRGSSVFIGLATKQMLLDEVVGEDEGSYSYASCGQFWGHAGKGSHGWGRPYIEGKPKFWIDDVIGCGVDLATRQIIYTKNGRRLDTTGLFVAKSATDLFPCVTLLGREPKIEANFGPNFEFKF